MGIGVLCHMYRAAVDVQTLTLYWGYGGGTRSNGYAYQRALTVDNDNILYRVA